MPDCEHLARTSAYFDGALSPTDEEAAAAHLATCAPCQRLLSDAVGLDVALAEARPAAREGVANRPTASTRARRWPLVVGVAVAAAAVVALVLAWPSAGTERAPEVAVVELPRERALEARFSGERFGVHRPRGVVRAGGAGREAISLDGLATLERIGAVHDLVAALAASGDIARARDLAATLPDDVAGAVDRAAIALAEDAPDRALAEAQDALAHAPAHGAAWWNYGLAARELGLRRVARAAFERVAENGERGWADEARAYASSLADELAIEDGFAAFDTRGRAMVDGGPPLSADDVARYPAYSRVHFYDAARLAPDRARLDALRPLAEALDRASSTTTATAALGRIDPDRTRAFHPTYQALIARSADPADVERMLARLRGLGRGGEDLRVGALILSGQASARLDELTAIVRGWNDPWFTLLVEREAAHARVPDGDLRVDPLLAEALSRCTGDAWAMRCGQLAQDLAATRMNAGREDLAEAVALDAVARFRAAVVPALLVRARSLAAEIHRLQGRTALARAELEEVELAASDRDCDIRRYAQISRAELALGDGDWDAVRVALPAPEAPAGCTRSSDIVGIATAIDLARTTQVAADRERAEHWLASAGGLADGGLAAIGALRLGHGDPHTVARWVAAHPGAGDPEIAGVRAWGVTTLVDDAGRARQWAGVLEAATAPATGCVLVASVDDERVTIAARAGGVLAGDHRAVPIAVQATTSLVPAAIVEALRACDDIAVVARPPLHGRSDLLPPELPWWFAGDAPPRAGATGPRRAVEVVGARPPDPSLPRLSPTASRQTFDARVAGADATPSRVLAALRDATYAELHVHGVNAAHTPGAAHLALSPEPDGAYELRAATVAAAKLTAAPVVVLAACRAATVAPYLRERWSLPDAFLTAGASAVIAADIEIPDAEARPVFDDLRRRLEAGEPPPQALAAVRAGATAAWVRRLMLFR